MKYAEQYRGKFMPICDPFNDNQVEIETYHCMVQGQKNIPCPCIVAIALADLTYMEYLHLKIFNLNGILNN
jgi:hypothetical protein